MIHTINTILNVSWRKTRKTFLPVAICAAVLSACGGGADSSSTAAILAPTLKSVSANVVATDADCILFNANNHVLASAKSSSNKVVDFGKVNASGNVLVSCTGGKYEDLSTGVQLTAGTHHGVAKLNDTDSTTVAVNPLTELAYRQAGGDVAQVGALAKAVALSFEIGPDADLQGVQPIDLLTTEAKKDDIASQYGVALAALSQARKDLSSTENAILTMIQQTWTAKGLSGDGQTIVLNGKLHLRDAAYNLNPAVRANVLGSVKANLLKAVTSVNGYNYEAVKALSWANGGRYGQGVLTTAWKGTVWQTPWASQILALPAYGNFTGIPSLVGGQTYLVGVFGHKLQSTLINFSGMTCTNTWLEPNEEIWTECTVDATATQARMWLTTNNGVTVKKYSSGGDPTTVWPVTPANNCPVPTVTSMTPTSAYYGVNTIFTLNGCGFTDATTATLEGVSCTLIAGGTDKQRTYNCPVTTDRTKPSGPLVAGGNTTGTQTVTYLGAPVTITAVSPSPLTVGGTGGNPSTITGTGFYPGMPVRLNGVACNTNGTVNATGTQIIGADCSNVGPIPDVATVPMAVGTGIYSGTFPVPVVRPDAGELSLTAPTPIRVGTTGHVAKGTSSNSTGAITYVSSNPAIAEVHPTTGVITPKTPGTITITANLAAVPGKFGSNTKTTPVTVTAIPDDIPPTITFQKPSPVGATLGVDTTVPNPATVTCTGTAVNPYAPTVTYSITPTTGATINATTGVVTPTAAGSYTITVSVPAVMTASPGCTAGNNSYTLTVAKAPATLAFVNTNAVSTTVGGTSTKLANLTGVTGYAAPTGKITYSSSNPTVAEVDPNTGAVTGKTAGTTTITASSLADNNYNSAVTTVPYTVTVSVAPSPTITFQKPSPVGATLGVDATVPNPATVTCTGSGVNPYAPEVTYSITPTTGATINATTGVVTPTLAGTYTITAKVPAVMTAIPGCTAGDNSYTLTVAKAPATLAFTTTTLKTTTVGGTITDNPAKLTGVTGFATPNSKITYISSDSTIATVDANGVVTGVKAGTVTINASSDESDPNYKGTTAVAPYQVTVGGNLYNYVNFDGTTQTFSPYVSDTPQGWCAVIVTYPDGSVRTWENPSIDPTGSDLNSYAKDYTNLGNGAATDASGFITAMNALNGGRGYCGYTGWRLPTQAELESTVKAPVQAGTAWVDIRLFRNPVQATFWTSTVAGAGKATINYNGGITSSAALSTSQSVHLVRTQ